MTKYIRGSSLIAMQASGQAMQRYAANGHGDVVKMVDESGNIVVNYTYDAFGNETNAVEDANPFRYCGEY